MNDSFQQLDKVIHEKRGWQSCHCWQPKEMSFTDIRESLKMTDGNLITHIRTLQKAGYVALKSYKEKRPLTTCRLTAEGSDAFRGHVDPLEGIATGPENQLIS